MTPQGGLKPHDIMQRALLVFLFLMLAVSVGVAGYMAIEDWHFFDALYMTVITLATVGFGEIPHALSHHGRIFTIFLIIFGIGTAAYAFSSLTALVIEGDLRRVFRRRAMDKDIESMKGHIIVCGASRTGRYVIEELVKTHHKFVLVEKDGGQAAHLHARLGSEVHHIIGDATEDLTLQQAGVERAAGLVTALPTDKDNLFVVISARNLNPSLRIISKAVDEASRLKIVKAGADSVVAPNYIGGLRMVSEMIRPAAVSFLDIMLHDRTATIRIDDVKVEPLCPLDGKSLDASGIRQKTGLIVLAVRDGRNQSEYKFNPEPGTTLKANDYLVVMGTTGQVDKLRALVRV